MGDVEVDPLGDFDGEEDPLGDTVPDTLNVPDGEGLVEPEPVCEGDGDADVDMEPVGLGEELVEPLSVPLVVGECVGEGELDEDKEAEEECVADVDPDGECEVDGDIVADIELEPE